jgi:membrane protein
MIDTLKRGLAHLPPRPRRVVELVLRAVDDFFEDELFVWAAAVAFYGVLSMFPLLLASMALAMQLSDPDWAIAQLNELLAEVLPMSAEFVEDTVYGAYEARGSVGLISVAALLWTGSRVFNALTRALNIAYDVPERWTFLHRLGIQLLMTVTLGAVLVLAMVSHWAATFVHRVLDVIPADRQLMLAVLRETVTLGLLLLATFLIYRFVPRRRQSWKSALAGAVLATAGFRILRPIFVYYVEQFAEYELVYGSVATVVLVLLWSWLMSIVLLFGGEIAAHWQMMMVDGMSGEQVEREKRENSPRRRMDREAHA